MKGSKKNSNTPRIIIQNTNMNLKNDLLLVANYKNTTPSNLAKGLLRSVHDSYSEEMRKPLKD